MKPLLKNRLPLKIHPPRFLSRKKSESTEEMINSTSHIAPPGPMPIRLQRALDIPVAETSDEQSRREYVVSRGQFLARQDMWEELGQELRHHDRKRARTRADMSLAELLSYGARSDVVEPLVKQIQAGRIDPAKVETLPALEQLESAMDDCPKDYGVALVVIHALIDVAWAFHSVETVSGRAQQRSVAFQACMACAEEILDRFDAFEHNSPALAAARCKLLAAQPNPESRVVDDYEDLIELDPSNPSHMREFGRFMLPKWFGSYQQLEVQARRISALTEDIWGSGGYTWTCMDALKQDPEVLHMLEPELFIEGMHHIIERRNDQHTANLFAAFCSITLNTARLRKSEYQDQLHALRDAFDWILKTHLREVHPLVWALAEHDTLSDGIMLYTETLAKGGRGSAFRRIARHFETEIRAGARVVFGENGLQIQTDV
jgi:hypothetical protein